MLPKIELGSSRVGPALPLAVRSSAKNDRFSYGLPSHSESIFASNSSSLASSSTYRLLNTRGIGAGVDAGLGVAVAVAGRGVAVGPGVAVADVDPGVAVGPGVADADPGIAVGSGVASVEDLGVAVGSGVRPGSGVSVADNIVEGS